VAGEPNGQGISEIPVTLKEKGNNFLVNATCEIRFFELNDQSIDLSELDDRYARKDHTHPEFTELQGDIDEINEFLGTLEIPDINAPPPEGETDYRRRPSWFYCKEVMATTGQSLNFQLYNDGTGDLTTAHHFDINRGQYFVDGSTGFTEWDELLEQGEWLNFFIPGEHTYSGKDQYVDIQVGRFVAKIDGANGYDGFRFEVMAIRGTPAYATLNDYDGRINKDSKKVEMNYGGKPSAFATTDQLNASIDGVLDVSDKGDAELQGQIDFMKQELNTIVPIKEEGVWRMYANYAVGNCMPTNGNTSAMSSGEFSEVGRFYWGNGYLDQSGKDFTETITDTTNESLGTKFEVFLDKDNWGLYQCTRVYELSSKTYWDVTCLKSSGSYKSGDMPKFEFFENEDKKPANLDGWYSYTLGKIADQITKDNIHEHPGRFICVDGSGAVVDNQYSTSIKFVYFAAVDGHGDRPPVNESTRDSFSLKVWEIRTRALSRKGNVTPSFLYTPKTDSKPFYVGCHYNQAAEVIPAIKIHADENWVTSNDDIGSSGYPQYWRWPI
jgi:hypothetical protein